MNRGSWFFAAALMFSALRMEASEQEVWVALRAEHLPGSGTREDPMNGTGPDALDRVFEKLAGERGDDVTIHFAAGTFFGTHRWQPRNRWRIRGAGMNATIFRTTADSNRTDTIGFRGDPFPDGNGPNAFEISDLTVDFNVPALRKANRAFVHLDSRGKPQVSYFFLGTTPPVWNAQTNYRRFSTFLSRNEEPVVRHESTDFIVIKASRNEPPRQGPFWSALRPVTPANLSAWTRKQFRRGDAVAARGRSFLCIAEQTDAAPFDSKDWAELSQTAPDPMIYTHAAFIVSPVGGGSNRVQRVRVLNGCGSRFLDREAFLIGLGGDGCVIEDCETDLFRGDYSTCFALFRGEGSVIRRCAVRGNGGSTTMGFGGWQMAQCVFENNSGDALAWGANIDSLENRNCVFENNTFRRCASGGIRVNVNGRASPVVPGHTNRLHGLLIRSNVIDLQADAVAGAVDLGGAGLAGVQIVGNTFSAGDGNVLAVLISGPVENINIHSNRFGDAMRYEISTPVIASQNHTETGKAVLGLDETFATWPPRPKVKVVPKGESKTPPQDCRGVIVGPGLHQPDPFPGYRGFVGWESPARLQNGDWLVGFNAGYWHASAPTPLRYPQSSLDTYRRLGLPADIDAPTGGRAMFTRSTDCGRTWGKPQTLIDTPDDDRHPCFLQLSNGVVLCCFFTYAGEPPDGDFEKHPELATRVNLIRSRDGGKTWEQKPQVLRTPFVSDETDGPMVQLKDGSIVIPINGRPAEGPPEQAGLLRSTDNGTTWRWLSTVKAAHDLVETTVAELRDGRLVMMARPEGDIWWSNDRGKTWTPPVLFGMRMFAPSLYVLRDGTLVCLHGSYAPGNGGLRVIFSTDGGQTWTAPANDHGFLVDSTYGYGKAMELEDRSLFISYISTGGHRTEDAKQNAIWCIRFRVRPDHSGIDLLPAPNR